MSRLFDDASSQYIYVASKPVSAYPFTMAGWVYKDNGGTGAVLALYNQDAFTYYHFLGMLSGYTVNATSNDGSSASAITVVASSINTWTHCCGVWTSEASRRAYINGGNSVENTTWKDFNDGYFDGTSIGAIKHSTPASFMSGRIAEVGIWNVALTANEVAALGAGVSPLGIRRGSLVGYWPLWGLHNPEIDLTVGHRNMTLVGTPTEAAHAPVVPFRAQLYSPPMIEGAAGFAAKARRTLSVRVGSRG